MFGQKMKYLMVLLGAIALSIMATACTGPVGPTGPAGVAAGGTGLKIKITSVAIPADRKPVVTYKISDAKDNPLKMEDMDGTPPLPSFTIAKLVEADGNSHFESLVFRAITGTNYIVDGKTQNPVQGAVSQPAVDSGGKLTAKGPGEYVYTFGQAIAQDAYSPNVTHQVGGYITRDNRAYVGNDVFTFVPAGGEVKTNHQVSTTKACNQCHDPLQAHGGTRRELGLCVTCHTVQNIDPETGNSMDLKVLAHKLHDGRNLPSVKSGKPYIVVGFHQSVNNFGEIGWPQDIRNCTTCHQGGAQADNWKTKPSAAACGSCHDDVDFKTGKNHPGGVQADDKSCATCHQPEGAEFGSSITGAHVIPAASTQMQGLKAEIVKVTNTAPGQKPVVVFKLTDNKGNAVDPSELFSLSATLAYPTTDYAQRIMETIRRAGSPATATAAAVAEIPSKAVKADDGSYSYTMAMTVDPTWTGSLAVGMEGYRNVTISVKKEKDTTIRENFFNPVFYAAVTDAKPVARRQVIKVDNCNQCHKSLGNPAAMKAIHGGNRRNPEYCVFCHNANQTDEPNPPATKGSPTESVQFKYFIHSLHKGEARAVATSFGDKGQAKTKDVLYPGDLKDCAKCHVGTSYTLPLPSKVLAMAVTTKGQAGKTVAPITAACQGCHASASAAGHFELNTTAGGVETCAVCHSQTADFGMDKVHAH